MPGDLINGDKSIRVTVVTDNDHRYFVLLLINQEKWRDKDGFKDVLTL